MKFLVTIHAFLVLCQSASAFAPPASTTTTKTTTTTIGTMTAVNKNGMVPPKTTSLGTSSTSASSSSTTCLYSSSVTDAISTSTPAATPKYYDFRGHQCYAEVTTPKAMASSSSSSSLFGLSIPSFPVPPLPNSNQRPEIILIHGFGCSTVYWRETVRYLTTAGYTVHTLDLLGQGKSAKPGRADGIEYSIDLWADMVQSYIGQSIALSNKSLVVMGNSLGSVVALTVAANNPNVQGVGMYNCGIGMNSRNLLRDPSLSPIQVAIFTWIFDALDKAIFDNIPLLTYVLEKVVTRDLLRNALTGLYAGAQDPASRVTDDLVDSFYLPAKDNGSVEALNQIYTNDAGKTPMELHKEEPTSTRLSSLPMHLIWGDKDTVTPLEGPVGQFYKSLAESSSSPSLITLDIVENAGHIPFDEIPECNESMVNWLDTVVMKKQQQQQPSSTAGSTKTQKLSLFPWKKRLYEGKNAKKRK